MWVLEDADAGDAQQLGASDKLLERRCHWVARGRITAIVIRSGACRAR
jgi:hypothetical protein